MKDMAKSMESGDVLNIIAITHGTIREPPYGILQFGNGLLMPEHLADLMRGFKDGVQINFVCNACGSGGISLAFSEADQKNRLIIAATGPTEKSSGNGLVGWSKGKSISGRYRSSYFVDVIIKSLGKINLDAFGPTLAILRDDLKAGVHTNPQPGEAKSQPQIDGQSAQEASTTLQQLLHLDFMDFPSNPKHAARFLRQELHFQVLFEADEDQPVDDWGFGNCRAELEDLFKLEMEKADHPYLADEDSELLSAMERALNTALRGEYYKPAVILKALELRARIQSSFLSVYMHLTDICLVTFEGLEQPMDLTGNKDPEIRLVAAALGCFEKIEQLGIAHSKIFNFETFFNGMEGYWTPREWLATLIVRGATVRDFHGIMDRIEVWGEFGRLNREALHQKWPEDKKLVRNLGAGRVLPRTGQRDSPVMAFWLPHALGQGITLQQIYTSFDDKFVKIEGLFFRFFNLPNHLDGPYELVSASVLKKELENGREY
jgi:hypothetical protein